MKKHMMRTITSRGRAVADLLTGKTSGRGKAQRAIENLLKLSKSTVSDQDLKALKTEGRD